MRSRYAAVLPSLSVRARIILVVLVPVIGFLINALAYRAGETAVGAAFASARRAAAVAETRDPLTSDTWVLRLSAPEFAERPREELVQSFEAAHELAAGRLDIIALSIDGDLASDIALLRKQLFDVSDRFHSLAMEELHLGLTDKQGIRARMRVAGDKIESHFNEDLGHTSSIDAMRLAASLYQMQRFESEFRLGQHDEMAFLFNV